MSKRKIKVCVITAARSEYGLLKWIMKDIEAAEHLQLQVVVTGGHLLASQGHTVDVIKADGFEIDRCVDPQLETGTECDIAMSNGRMAVGFAEVFRELQPDYIMVLGDRYELLPICSTAFVMRIPIIHISGGDVTEGAIDDGIRNAVTMLADYHFPATEESADNIIRMRGAGDRVWAVGEPGLDAFFKEEQMSRHELADNLRIDEDKKWVLMTYHPETRQTLEHNLRTVKSILDELLKLAGYTIVATYANSDFGGREINELLEEYAKKSDGAIRVIPSLGQKRYLSFMREASFVIGNSSSGILEAPFLKKPVVNIGDRQKGRYQCENILQCSSHKAEIEAAIKAVTSGAEREIRDCCYWGDGHSGERIVRIIQEEILHE